MTNAATHQVPTGEALEKARRRVGFTVENAAAALGVSVKALGDYESGLRTPSEAILEAMVALYGVEPGRIVKEPWIPRVPPRYDSKTKTLWLGWNGIVISEGDNEQIIRSVADAVRSMRSVSHDAPIKLRATDFPLLSQLLDLSDDELPDILTRYLRLSPNDALSHVNEMVVVASARS